MRGQVVIGMAKYGDHPALPKRLEDLLMDDVHTVFIKADCPPPGEEGLNWRTETG